MTTCRTITTATAIRPNGRPCAVAMNAAEKHGQPDTKAGGSML